MKNKVTKVIELLIIFLVCIITLLIFMYIKDDKSSENIETKKSSVSIIETDSINEAINKVYDSVVLIESYNNGKEIGTGTGFVYKTDNKFGYILTNQHVIEDADEIKAVYINGNVVEAKLLGSDVLSDIAVLSVDKESILQVSTLGVSEESKIGDTIFTVGSPLGEDYMGTVTKGIISGLNRNVSVSTSDGDNILEVIQIDAAINPGNSGGPLVNLKGEVIGINSIKLVQDEVEGMGFSIPIELVLSITSNLENGQEIQRPVFGVTSTTIHDKYNLGQYDIQVDKSIENGIVILDVESGSSAGKAGIKVGDVIYEVENKKIDDIASFRHILYKHQIGDKINVKFYRNKQKKEVSVILYK